jgi:membrane associated rhomboid family serine protease
MIEDRYYMRRPAGGVYRSATFALIVMNAVAFLAQLVVEPRFPSATEFLALSSGGLRHGYVWQLLTFQFMHANFTHLLFNCLAIYMFGSEVEEAVGRRSFWTLYLSSGVFGGLFQALLGILLPGTMFEAPVVGASAGAFGLTAAFALLFPDRIILLFFFIPLRAKYLLPLSMVLAVALMFTPSQGAGVAHAAHMGGMAAGYVFVRYAVHWNFKWPRLGRLPRRPARRMLKVPVQKPGSWRESEPIEEDLPPDEFFTKEVDPILDKISARGIQSLTDRERRILERARSKVGKR